MSREILSMDAGWRFHLDDTQLIEPLNHNYVYFKTKAESGRGPADPAYYDGDWEKVTLPHDFVINEQPDPTVPAAHGFLRRRNGWYRRSFRLEPEDGERSIRLVFDGVCTHCKVWVNGHLLHRNFCGYTSFQVDISDVVLTDGRLNLVSVYVDNSDFEGWWYEGGGIYRHVWMVKSEKTYVGQWGTFITSQKEDGQAWTNHIQSTLCNDTYEERTLSLRSVIRGAKGEIFATAEQAAVLPPREKAVFDTDITVQNPELWDIENPSLYTLETLLMDGEREIDRYTTRFGYRTLRFDCNEGFFLNGRHVKLKGVCCHEDHANLGVAVPDRIRRQRMELLKSIGVNAYRCSHNPPTPEVLDYCDELGILVMDENRWFDASPQGLLHLENMLVRDRNHPSIILWSMANEEPLQGCERGQKIMAAMRSFTAKLDSTRPVLLAMHTGITNKAVGSVSDIIGVNYNYDRFDEIHAAYPNTPMVLSEIGGLMDEFNIMRDGTGYDWMLADQRPFVMGLFHWTGYRYRGETRGWPKLYSRSGLIEQDAEPSENTYFTRAMWCGDDFVKIAPFHWNYDAMIGDLMDVTVYTGGDEAEVFLNDKSMGRFPVPPYERARIRVPYEPGLLKAVAYRGGSKIGEDQIETTGAAVKITLKADAAALPADGTSVFTLWAGAQDAQGRPVLWADQEITFQVEGDVQVLATQSADQYDAVPPRSLARRLYHGSCNMILRAGTHPGMLVITAQGKGLEGARLEIPLEACVRPPHLPEVPDVDHLTYFSKME